MYSLVFTDSGSLGYVKGIRGLETGTEKKTHLRIVVTKLSAK
jgi:hypothetical protein